MHTSRPPLPPSPSGTELKIDSRLQSLGVRLDTLSSRKSFATPACRGYSHVLFEGALEGGVGLIACGLRNDTDRGGRSSQLVSSESHADLHQEIGGRASHALLEVTHEGGSRHVAEAREFGESPWVSRILQHRRESGREPWLTDYGQKSCGHSLGFA